MQKTIQVRQYNDIPFRDLSELGLPFYLVHSLYYQGKEDSKKEIDAIIVGNTVYCSFESYSSNKKAATVLTNDFDLWLGEIQESAEVILEVPEDVCQDKVSEFGVVIDDNIALTQFSVSIYDLEDYYKDALFCYWGVDGRLYADCQPYEKEQIEAVMKEIAQIGYDNCMLLYADSFVQPVRYAYLYYVYQTLNCLYVPVRLLSYIDIAYLRTLAPVLYRKVKALKKNPYFRIKDERNYCDDFVLNYSDKVQVLSKLISWPNTEKPDNVEELDKSNWYPVFYFVFSDKYQELNQALADTLKKVNPGKSLAGQKDIPLHDEAVNYLRGYRELLGEEISPEKLFKDNQYTVTGKEKRLPVSDMHLLDVGYEEDDNSEKEMQILQKEEADIMIDKESKTTYAGASHLHNLVNKAEPVVAYIQCK